MSDYLASLILFGFLVVVFFSFWNSIASGHNEFSEERQMRADAVRTTSLLVTTSGYPEDWDSNNVQILGFAEDDQVLDENKLGEFGSMNYNQQSSLLQVQDFSINISDGSGTLEINGEDSFYGQPPTSDANTVVPITRNVLVNKSGDLTEAEMQYVVWR